MRCLDLLGRESWDWVGPPPVIQHEPIPPSGVWSSIPSVSPLQVENGSAQNPIIVVAVSIFIVLVLISLLAAFARCSILSITFRVVRGIVVMFLFLEQKGQQATQRFVRRSRFAFSSFWTTHTIN